MALPSGRKLPIDIAMPKRLLKCETWVFDLDNCLYPANQKLFDQIDARMGAFIGKMFDVDAVEARRIQKDYFYEFGTTLAGLMHHHGLDPHDYLDFVHDIDLSPIESNERMSAALGKIPGRKIIYTNADANHAGRVLKRIGIEEHFEAVHDVHASDYVPKPRPSAYAAMLERHEIDPKKAVMVEDLARNLSPASEAGLATVWVRTTSEWSGEGANPDHIDHTTDDLTAWLEALTAEVD